MVDLEGATLQDVRFSDIYLGKTNSWLSGVPNTGDPVLAPPQFGEELARIRQMCEEYTRDHPDVDEFTVTHKRSYRVSPLVSTRETVYVLRRFPEMVPSLGSLNLDTTYITPLLQKGITGLVIVSGAFNQGKTTTASAIIKERLERFGGICVTIEDPPELPLEGQHGEGVCYQTWIRQGGFGQACRNTARWAPSIIFLGEIRDGESAMEALRASINGRLVICTLHADNIETAVERIFALGVSTSSNSEDVASLIANGLAGVVHQKLEGRQQRIPQLEFLWVRGASQHSVATNIRGKKFLQLRETITQQRNLYLHSGKVPA